MALDDSVEMTETVIVASWLVNHTIHSSECSRSWRLARGILPLKLSHYVPCVTKVVVPTAKDVDRGTPLYNRA